MSGETIVSLFAERARTDAERIALVDSVERRHDQMNSISWYQWHELSRSLAAVLTVQGGLQRGDRVAILAGNTNWWPIADLGVLIAGGVSVGIYPSSSREQVAHQLRDSGARMAIADGPEHCRLLAAAAGEVPGVKWTIGVDDTGTSAVLDLREFIGAGRHLMAKLPHVVEAHLPSPTPDDLALLIYTSGSTGEPKGARILHRTVLASARAICDTLGLTDADSTLSFLPYSHAGERIFGLYTRILAGMRVTHVHDGEKIWDVARTERPTLFGGLPRWYEKMHEALMVETKGRDLAGAGRDVIARFVGDNVRLATSGGAKLSPKVAADLDAAGLTILGAYGQTEHLCAAFHRPDRYDFETVGFPMPGTEVKLDDDGELLIRRSDLTFDGYHNRPEETRAAFTADGEWLRTGDLASIEPDGRIRITGRKKELIVTAGGKNVAPSVLEDRMRMHALISQCMVVGDGRPFVGVLVTIDPEAFGPWKERLGKPASATVADLRDDPDLNAEVQAAVDDANKAVSRAESIRKFRILDGDFTQEQGHLSAKLGIKRAVLAKEFASDIEALYS